MKKQRPRAFASNRGNSVWNRLKPRKKAVVSVQKRLETATAKLEEAKTQGSDLVDALQTGVDKTREKLVKAEQALTEYQQSQKTEDTPADKPPVDAARAAIERAMAKRQAEASHSPAEKAQADLAKLQQRLQKTEATLEQSRTNGDEEKVIIALESTVARLTDKISTARQQLQQAEDA